MPKSRCPDLPAAQRLLLVAASAAGAAVDALQLAVDPAVFLPGEAPIAT